MIIRQEHVLQKEDLGRIIRDVSTGTLARLETRYETTNLKAQLEVYYDDSTVNHKGVVIYFSGGNGRLFPSLSHSLIQIANDGWILCNWIAPEPMDFIGVQRHSLWAIHNYTHWGFEADTAVDYFYTEVLDTLPTDNINPDCYLIGHSRGAGVVSFYAGFSDADKSQTSQYVKGCGASSPAGGVTIQPYVSIRATLNMFNQAKIPFALFVGAGDLTHTSRAYMEKVNFSASNDLSEIYVIGDENNGHQVFGSDYLGFFYASKAHIDKYY